MKEERWIVASDGTPQMAYIGKTKMDDDEVIATIEDGGVIVLTECRALRTILVPNEEGIAQQNYLTPHNIALDSVTITIKPVSWWWLNEDKFASGKYKEMMDACQKAALATRAKNSGLVMPRTNNDGMRLKR